MAVPAWRFFRVRDFVAALEHAKAGGVAVHANNMRFRGHRTAHMFAPDELTLIDAARSVGVDPKWIQRNSRGSIYTHYDLFGEPLRRAIARCGERGAVPDLIP